MTSLLWFRQDLRLYDHPALVAAVAEGDVVPVYVLDDETPGDRRIGSAQRWWLHHSLARLKDALPGLILRRGNCVDALARLVDETGANRIHAIQHYEPWWQAAENAVSAEFDLVLHPGSHLAAPASILTGGGTRYRVFSPWWRALLDRMPPPKPIEKPEQINCPEGLATDRLEDWHLLSTHPDWATGFDVWIPGEEGARDALRAFLPRLRDYDGERNFPSREGISRLSPHIHFGEISPATIWHVAAREAGSDAECFLRELGWRDFGANLVDQFPLYHCTNGRPAYDCFAWRSGADADADFAAWTKGETGYPIVDAGMRELWATGFMHNRVRMIAASFLIKHLLIDWRRGEQWFWDTLVDADAGSNAANWQYASGTGVDAPLFSRMMAPLLQSEKFDCGDYIRKWVPELAGISDPYVHDPAEFGARPANYPDKLIGHRAARERALAAVADCKSGGSEAHLIAL